jgi:hypothetical protein
MADGAGLGGGIVVEDAEPAGDVPQGGAVGGADAQAVDAAPIGGTDARPGDVGADDAEVQDAQVVDAAEPDAAVACVVGEVQPCGVTQGRCRAGRQRCLADSTFGPCEGEVGPAEEVCNGADDDCNGVTDDGFEVGGACEGVGECAVGVVECRNDRLTRCSTDPGGSRAGNAAESCDGTDEDCDGRVDEDFMVGRACAGRCGDGRLECAAARDLVCSTDPGGSAFLVADELCNAEDDDCDGRVDEAFPLGTPCEGVGACGPGVGACGPNGEGVCSTEPGGPEDASTPELCNGQDDDCDGSADENFDVGVACDGIGACGAGRTECAADGRLVCSTDPGGSMAGARAEACNAADDDCDGQVDEGLGLGTPCPAVGACAAGVLECAADGSAVCSTGPGGSRDQSTPEACDGADEDCDGRADEDFRLGGACDGLGACGPGLNECGVGGLARCSTDSGGSADDTAPEACNGLDDDCDGVVDDGGACGGDTCLTAPGLPFDTALVGNTSALVDDYPRSVCLAASPGPDQVFRIDPIAAGRVVVGVAPLMAGMDPLFWVNADCAQPESCVVNGGRDLFGAGRPEARAVNIPRAGPYFVMVDGRVFGQGGPFLVTARPQGDGEDCNRAVPLAVPGRFVGTTEERSSDIASAMCTGGSGASVGPDQVFRLDPPRNGRLTATLSPGPNNLRFVLMVTTNCGVVDQGCVGSAVSARAGDGVSLAIDVVAGTTYYLIVDHPGQPGGSFFLDLALP